MKLLTTLTISIITLIGSYMSVDRSISAALNTGTSRNKVNTVIAGQCPDDSSIISRNLREEGIVSKIKTQSVNRSYIVGIKVRPN